MTIDTFFDYILRPKWKYLLICSTSPIPVSDYVCETEDIKNDDG